MIDTETPRVVVIDDNKAARYSTSRILRGAGLEVIEAATGTEGLKAVDPDTALVVLDINLPDIDGFEVCRRLRAQPSIARIPVVHLSATFIDDSDKVKGLEGGADGYLTHPVEPLVLLATVRALLRARRAEEEMRRGELRFRAIFDQVPTAIALVGEDLRSLQVNPAMGRLLGRSEQELSGVLGADFVADEWRAVVKTALEDIKKNGNWSGYVPVRSGDGSLVDVEWDVRGFSRGTYLVMGTDVTQRRRAEADREQLLESERAARSDAERANRTKDDFLATLSHELRNPLHVIVGWSGVLTQFTDDPQILTGLKAVERSADLLEHLIADLLDVSRITSGKLSLNTELVDLTSVVDAAVAVVTPSAVARQIRIERSYPEHPIFVTGDPARLQQVAWNLLSNAIKFTPAGGVVAVLMDAGADAVEFAVSDTGRGIAKQFLPHIFERFRQESSGSRTAGGLGLGLAIVKHVIEMHGGQVQARSDGEGRGSTFTVSLPLRPANEKTDVYGGSRLAHSPQTFDFQGVRVLLVDDDAGSRALARRILAEAGAEIAEAGDVTTALELLQSFQPGLLVSDIGMPERDGYDLIREVRRLGFSPQNLPALAVTAFVRPQDRRAILDAGYQMHLAKPVDSQKLLVAVSALAGERE